MVSTAKLAGEFSAQHHEKTSPVKMKAGDLGTLEEIDTIEETDSDKFVWLVSLTASLGGFLFGVYLHPKYIHIITFKTKRLRYGHYICSSYISPCRSRP